MFFFLLNSVPLTSDMTKIFLGFYDLYVKFTPHIIPESNGHMENCNKEISKFLKLLGFKNKG